MRRLTFSRDGKHILSGSAIEKVEIRDVATGSVDKAFEGTAGTNGHAAFSPDGTMIFSSFNGTGEGIQIWEAGAGQKAGSIEGGVGSAFVFTPDGKMFIEGGGNKAHMKDANSGQTVRTFEGHTVDRQAFSGFSRL